MKKNLLGEMIKKYRNQNLWSQETFADQCGISCRTLQRIEGGEKANVETLRAFANFWKVDVDNLIPLNESVSPEHWEALQNQIKVEGEKIEKELSTLLETHDAKELLNLTSSCETYQQDFPTPSNSEEAKAFGDILQSIRDFSDIHDELEPSQRVETVAQIQLEIDHLNSLGFKVFAGKMKGWVVFPATAIDGKPPLKFKCAAVVIKPENDKLIFKNKSENNRECILIRRESEAPAMATMGN